MSLPYTVRPLSDRLGPVATRRESPFSSTWTSTLDLLDRELRALGAKRWVLELNVSESQIRQDGGVYVRATPSTPAVRVAFDSKHGPLIYACDRFWRWQDNVRAIALSLEALRKVDRYGVAGHGEQYRGWAQIDARPHQMTRDEAAELIADWAGNSYVAADLLRDSGWLGDAYRRAGWRVHPDVTGDDGDSMARLNAARDLLLQGAKS
jgi:hypothetical protein